MDRTEFDANAPHAAMDRVLRAWLAGSLDAESARAARDAVSAVPAWRDAYQRLLRATGRALFLTAWLEDSALDLCPDGTVEGLAPAFSLALPHLGPDARLTVHVGSDRGSPGSWWSAPIADLTRRFIPRDAPSLAWGDPTTGSVVTRISWVSPADTDIAWRMLCDLQRVAAGAAHVHSLRLAKAISAALSSGFLRDSLARAASAFRSGDEVSEADLTLVGHAISLARTLDTAASQLLVPELFASLPAIEDALQPYADAVEMLSPAQYARAIDDDLPVEGSWWGARLLQEQRAPHIHAPPPKRSVRSPAVVAYAASAVTPTGAGCVPLLLQFGDRGIVGSLRIRAAHGGAAGLHELPLRPLALNALRTAFQAAAARMPHGLPKFPLEDHAFDFSVPALDAQDTALLVDGDSLALPAALAFTSLWQDLSLPEDLAATASLRLDPKVSTGAVGGGREKSEALVASRSGRACRLLVHPSVRIDVEAQGITVVPVETLDEALTSAGLRPLANAGFEPWLGDLASRRKHVSNLCDDVELQHLDAYALAGFDPWTVLGDRLRLLVRSLDAEESTPALRDMIVRARALGALAFTHAGDDEAAGELLRGLGLDAVSAVLNTPQDLRVSPSVRALLLLVELGRLIDQDDSEANRALADRASAALDDTMSSLDAQARDALTGKILGTQGRMWLHRRRPETARALFERSVKAHDVPGQRHELGRSRVSLARALRMLGRHDEALAEFRQAGVDLDGHTRRFSQPYHASCWMFLRYERARLLVEMERAGEAEHEALDALHATEGRGWWPRAGVLRVLAWALRLQGRAQSADAQVDAILGMMRDVPAWAAGFLDRMAQEAARMPQPGDDVY